MTLRSRLAQATYADGGAVGVGCGVIDLHDV